MFRRFWQDRRGNYMLLTAAAIVPIMGALAIGIDYAEMTRQRQATLNALDAAGIATARRVIEGASEAELVTYANDFFLANLGPVDPENATLQVVLPQNNTGGGTLELTAELNYKPYFLPAFRALMKPGFDAGSANVDFTARSEVRLKNTLEVALVLDNSGSMDYRGSGSGNKRIDLLKDAAKQLVDTIAAQGAQMKQVPKPVQFGLVPFAASVNVGADKATESWMDTKGVSPIHHENFDWTTMTGQKRVQLSGGMYVKKGDDWGDEENEIVSRFTLFDELTRVTGQEWSGGQEKVCKLWWRGSCYWWDWEDTGEWTYTYGSYASWQGCVEARPHPYDKTDTPPSAATPATLFVPMFAPDETDLKDGSGRRANGDWWPDMLGGSHNDKRQAYMPKYFAPAPDGTAPAGAGQGPNASCTTEPITPLKDVSKTAGLNEIKGAIDAMAPNGATNVPQGIAWGWRVVSGGEPFTEGRPDSEKGNDKVVIVLTDGANTYYTPGSLGYNDLAGNKSTYSSYGYTGRVQPGETATRLFMGTGSDVGKSDFSNGNYSDALNEQMTALCTNAKDSGVIMMTVSLDLSTSDNAEKKQIAALKECASYSRFRKDPDDPSKPAKLYWNATGSDLADKFKEIADELSNLRIVS
ncbi:pilus assembly protein [Aquibium sp. A9E412]|uniref:TadE/TadG family type IV pilus assembly protein n=1 Tax=Aquibium sp. A9E412 TaxID=2976767 RepID=UPI0025AFA088|nr:TadE/TadG family type IV pilus assembly protein [Aquibium sp. A9E412]MDN2566260.1 pilus assembly protein [Aquibium sp. A9E412]